MRPPERGQASVEVLGGLPLLLIAGLAAFQLAATAYSLHLADAAAEAGALAVAGGAPAAPAVRAALPAWARARTDVTVDDGRVGVAIVPPGPFAAVGGTFAVGSNAWARPPDD